VSLAGYYFLSFSLSMQSCFSVPVSPAHFAEAPPAALESLELPEEVLPEDEVPPAEGLLLLGELVDGLEVAPLELAPLGGAPASLLDDPLDDVPPALLLVPPPAPPAPAPAPAPCAHDAVAKPTMAAVMAAQISFSFIARFL
jgi:hypothetical protein